MTYRERREQRAERLRDYAESNEAKADAAHERVHQIADQIPFGQPILVGHHSEGRARRDQARMEAGMRQSVEADRKAKRQEERAANIESQLAQSIYTDDEDAKERLEAKIAGLEAERDRIKAYNASCRRGKRDMSLLAEKEQAELVSVAKVAPYQIGKNGSAPSYWLTNLSGNIRRLKERLKNLDRDQARLAAGKEMFARFGSTCDECGEPIAKGDRILYFRSERRAVHVKHGEETSDGED